MKAPLLRVLAGVLALALALLAGCASPPAPRLPPPPPLPSNTYVVLLPNADGTVGQVGVTGPGGVQRQLRQALQAADLLDSSPPFTLPREIVQRDFAAALAARPVRPEQFLLYFETGGAVLTAQSRALLATIIERARARASADLSVIGHTDSQGRPEANEALGLQRAAAVAQQLRDLGVGSVPIAVESHGARNQLVATPDQTAEPRNRRVEVTLR